MGFKLVNPLSLNIKLTRGKLKRSVWKKMESNEMGDEA